jgi:hypothetical protein
MDSEVIRKFGLIESPIICWGSMRISGGKAYKISEDTIITDADNSGQVMPKDKYRVIKNKSGIVAELKVTKEYLLRTDNPIPYILEELNKVIERWLI